MKSIATLSALAAVGTAQTYPFPSLTPSGDSWTLWSDWSGCSNIAVEDFCAFPDNYLANSVRYRECRLADDENHPWDATQTANTVQPPQGDPAMTLDFSGIPTAWTQGIQREQSSPSTRMACDPRLEDYMAAPPAGMPVYADIGDLEVAIATDPARFQPYIPAPYKRIVFEFALCINVHKCPRPLPWSSWNCHCLGTGQANNDNLPLCSCGNGQTVRSRVQLCQDWDNEDSLTCESVGESIANNPILGTAQFPNRCVNTVDTNVWTQEFYGNQAPRNWYQQILMGDSNSGWIQKTDAGHNNNLDATYQLSRNGDYTYSFFSSPNDGFSTSSGYINQCFDKSRFSTTTNGYVEQFLMNYNDVRNDVEYGFQEMTCQSVEAAWSNWGAWGRCSQSCDGGVTRRTRSCVSQGIVVDVLAGDPGCGCPGSSFEEQVCNTFCCPVWQICTADDCGNDDWTPLSAAADGAFAFGACPECGDTTLELTRHCKCREPDGRFRFGDLTTPAFSTTFANFQHDCPLAVGEVVENSFAGIAYIAKTSKVCDGPCCEGWQPWSEWGACDDSCFDSNNGALTAPAVARTQTRNRSCGCEGTTEVATDFSNCPSLDGLSFLPAETETRACTAEPSPCAYWAEWGAYSACSATCRPVLYDGTAATGARYTCDPQDAGALQVRERDCNFGDVGAAGCPEADRTESQACVILGDCCQYDQWSLWSQCLTDVGESCSANGQPGKRTRQRNTVCGDPLTCDNCNHVEECELPKCPTWAEWGMWSECSMSCGPGTKSRTRDCCGDVIGSDACPCNGDFNSAVSQCDFGGNTCSNYYTTGTQLDLWNARVNAGAHDATDMGYIDIMSCEVKQVCPYLQKMENSNELMWTEWSTCSTSCGNGVERRQRICNHGILGVDPECSGLIHEDRPCSSLPCPRVTEWQTWSECSVTCGMDGERSRVRLCEKPANITANCIEPLDETVRCVARPCPMLTQWSQWTTCSEECDTRLGVTVRERACEHGMIGEDGCDESAYQSQFCNQDKPCPSWGSWSSWTACREVSQNIFAHSRTRNCENGALGSRECPVDGADQEAPCDSEFCAQTNVGTSDNDVYIPRGSATGLLISFTSVLVALIL